MTSCHNHIKCSEKALHNAEIICEEHHLRLTPVRKKVLSLIWQGHYPIKAYDLLEQLQKEDPSAKPTTIYRALDFLLENHLIHRLESQNAFVGCTHPAYGHYCVFLLCNQCHTVSECCEEPLVNTIQGIASSKHFLVKNITLEIQGICSSCQK